MSSRTAERQRAIRLAWEREKGFVQEGKGTRDWTKEQQADILNPEVGRAYDDQGRAFEGQHMKSVAEYPNYAGNPDNIQFLTKDEHLEAHKGSWKNPTNWYYDPVAKEYIDFGDGAPVPCRAVKLSDPIAILPEEKSDKDKSEYDEDDKTGNDKISFPGEHPRKTQRIIEESHDSNITVSKRDNWIVKGLKRVGKFVITHPVESLEIAGTVFVGVAKVVSLIRGESTNDCTSRSNPTSDEVKADIADQISDIVEKANRVSPSENDVSAHKQRYHTKDGVIWKNKAPYHRGSKDN